MIDAIGSRCELEVDGGIDPETAPLVVEAGARVLVAGSSIYGSDDGVAAAMERLRNRWKHDGELWIMRQAHGRALEPARIKAPA